MLKASSVKADIIHHLKIFKLIPPIHILSRIKLYYAKWPPEVPIILVNFAQKIRAEDPYKVWFLHIRLEFVTIFHFNRHNKFTFRHFGKFTRNIVHFKN